MKAAIAPWAIILARSPLYSTDCSLKLALQRNGMRFLEGCLRGFSGRNRRPERLIPVQFLDLPQRHGLIMRGYRLYLPFTQFSVGSDGGEEALYRTFVERGPVRQVIVHDSIFWRELENSVSDSSTIRILSESEEDRAVEEAKAFLSPVTDQVPDPFSYPGDPEPHDPSELNFQLEWALSYLLIGNRFKAGILEDDILENPAQLARSLSTLTEQFGQEATRRLDSLARVLESYDEVVAARLRFKGEVSSFEAVLELLSETMVRELSEANFRLGLVKYRTSTVLRTIRKRTLAILANPKFQILSEIPIALMVLGLSLPEPVEVAMASGVNAALVAIRTLNLEEYVPPIERLDFFELGLKDGAFMYQNFNYNVTLVVPRVPIRPG